MKYLITSIRFVCQTNINNVGCAIRVVCMICMKCDTCCTSCAEQRFKFSCDSAVESSNHRFTVPNQPPDNVQMKYSTTSIRFVFRTNINHVRPASHTICTNVRKYKSSHTSDAKPDDSDSPRCFHFCVTSITMHTSKLLRLLFKENSL